MFSMYFSVTIAEGEGISIINSVTKTIIVSIIKKYIMYVLFIYDNKKMTNICFYHFFKYFSISTKNLSIIRKN